MMRRSNPVHRARGLLCPMRGPVLLVLLAGLHGTARSQCPGIDPAFTWVSENGVVRFTDVTDTYGYGTGGRLWEFGYGLTGSAGDTTITYPATGVDSVKLHLWVEGCAFIAAARVAHGDANDDCTVLIEPGFTWVQPANNLVSFTNTTGAPGIDLFSAWEFGDNLIEFVPAPTHAYLFPGSYTASLSMAGTDTSTSDGCVAGIARRIHVDGNASSCDSSLFLDMSYTYDGSFAQFEAVAVPLSPGLQVDQLVWDMGDGSAAISSVSASHYFLAGEHQVCLAAFATDPGLSDSCSAMVCMTLVPNLLGIGGPPASAQWSAWPDPFTEAITVRTGAQGMVEFVLIDALGREMDRRSMLVQNEARLDLAGLPSGAYILRMNSGGRQGWCRIIKR